MKIAFVTSQGGHSGQIKLIFTDKVIGNNDAILITEKPGKDLTTKEKYFNKRFKTYFFQKDVLLKPNPFLYLKSFLRLLRIYKKEKVDLVITNGAQISIPAVLAAKILGIKSIFIETVIRVETKTWSASACYPFVDIFLVQHPTMVKKFGKKARYVGGII